MDQNTDKLLPVAFKVGGEENEWLSGNCRSFSLDSHYDRHHTFRIEMPMNAEQAVTLEQLEAVLGEAVVIRFGGEVGLDGFFRGLIDKVQVSWAKSAGRVVVVEGFSPTVLFDSGRHFRCFAGQTMGSLVDNLAGNYKGWLGQQAFIDGNHQTLQIDWAMQIKESRYNFLKRVTDRYGMEVFYDGLQLRVGPLSWLSGETIALKKDRLQSVAVGVNTAPINFALTTQDYIQSRPHREKSPSPQEGDNLLLNAALRKSKVYGQEEINLPGNHAKSTNVQLVERMFSANFGELVTIDGESSDLRLRVGTRIKLELDDLTLPNSIGKGTYIITSVNHTYTPQYGYGNEFKAVPINLPYGLRSTYQQPATTILAAEVASTQSDQYGRVQVKFLGDPNQAQSPPIRVQQTCGGFYGIPPKGKQVFVQYNAGDDADLFITGDYFHEGNRNSWPQNTGGIRRGDLGLILNWQAEEKRTTIFGPTLDLLAEKEANVDSKKIHLACNKAQAV